MTKCTCEGWRSSMPKIHHPECERYLPPMTPVMLAAGSYQGNERSPLAKGSSPKIRVRNKRLARGIEALLPADQMQAKLERALHLLRVLLPAIDGYTKPEVQAALFEARVLVASVR